MSQILVLLKRSFGQMNGKGNLFIYLLFIYFVINFCQLLAQKTMYEEMQNILFGGFSSILYELF